MNTTFLRRLGVMFACAFLCSLAPLAAQTKVGYVSTDVIRERFPDAQQADQRIKTMTDEWKKEIEDRRAEIDNMRDEIQRRRLVWSDDERAKKEEALRIKTEELEVFSRSKFGPNGEFDVLVRDIYRPIEEKISAAVEAVSRADGYDIIWDKSTQNLLYVNPRYDITVAVMERLEIQVDDLKAQQEELLKNAPKEEERSKPRRRVRRPRNNDGN
jgi:outer membrane protein